MILWEMSAISYLIVFLEYLAEAGVIEYLIVLYKNHVQIQFAGTRLIAIQHRISILPLEYHLTESFLSGAVYFPLESLDSVRQLVKVTQRFGLLFREERVDLLQFHIAGHEERLRQLSVVIL